MVVATESMSPSAYERKEKTGSFVTDTLASFVPVDQRVPLMCAAAGLLACGSFDSIASKWQNLQYLNLCDDPNNPDCAAQYFEAPFWQTFTMYIGETFCLFLFWVDDTIAKHKKKQRFMDFAGADSMNKKKSPIWWWLCPTVMDFIGSTMINYAVVITLASTVQLLRNFNIVITALLTIFYLRRALTVGQFIGVGIVTVGMIITALYAIIYPSGDSNMDESLSWLGCLLAIVGTILNGFQFVFEERLFRKFYMPPLKAVGVEGGFGLIISAVALVVVQFAGLEDVRGALFQIGHSGILVWSTVLYVLCITGFNAAGLMVTKLGSGLLRAVLVAGRSVAVWVIEICIGWNTFDLMNFFGMLIIAFGVLYYNNAYPMSCCPSYEKAIKKEVPCCGFVELTEDPDKEEVREDVILAEAEKRSITTSSSRTSSNNVRAEDRSSIEEDVVKVIVDDHL